MSDPEDTKQCPNCKLDILSPNFIIHYVHCQRNFYICHKCGEPVNYKEREEHDKTNHVTVHCTNCHFALEKFNLNDHLEFGCPNREVKCKICDIDIKVKDLLEHEDYCGARTEKCPECGEFVMLKYKTLHLETNHTFMKLSDEPGPSPSWQNGRRTLYNFMPDLATRSSLHVTAHRRKSNENFTKSNNSDVDEWPMLNGLGSLQICEEKQQSPTGSYANNAAAQSKEDEDEDLLNETEASFGKASVSCSEEVNKKEKAFKKWFKPLTEKELFGEKSIKQKSLENNSKTVESEPGAEAYKNNYSFHYDKHESVKLPCEFCGDLIVSNELIFHQSRCNLYKKNTYSLGGSSLKVSYFDEDMQSAFPCGFCSKIIRLSALKNHELHCTKNFYKFGKSQSHPKNLKAVNMKSERGLQHGLEGSSPQVTRMGTRSEWFSDFSNSTKEGQEMKNNLNHPESGAKSRTTKASRKNRRAPSPPGS